MIKFGYQFELLIKKKKMIVSHQEMGIESSFSLWRRVGWRRL